MKILLLVISIAFAANANAEFLPIQKLNADLKASKAGWVAKDNWLNHLSQHELVRMMGAKGVHPKGIELSTQNYTSGTSEVFDWRNQNGVSYVSPVLNQGNCGSCVAFATVATLETQMNISSGIAFLNPHYSAEALFACGGGGCESGWWPEEAAGYLQSTGVPDEACAPYTMGATGNDVQCSSICQDAASRSQKIASYSSPSGIDAVKRALKQGPLMTTLNVYADFITYHSGVYKHTTGSVLGGHAISIVGFDDTKRAWIIRNSWGNQWGTDGFAYVSYDDVSGVAEDNQLLTITQPSDFLYSDLRDRAFISGATDLTVSSKNKDTSPITLKVNGVDGSQKSITSCATASCALHLDTTTMEDGRYTLEATKGSATLHRYFFVSNKPENFQITMTPEGFDPSKPIKDRIVFDIDMKTDGVVPMQRVALEYQNDKGEVLDRWTDNILNQMTFGWRTPMVPNGHYKVWVKGEYTAGGQTLTFNSNSFDINIQN